MKKICLGLSLAMTLLLLAACGGGTANQTAAPATPTPAPSAPEQKTYSGKVMLYSSMQEDQLIAIKQEAAPDIIDPAYVDPDGYYTAGRLVGVGIAYNTVTVSEDEAPKTWNELLDEKWNDQIVMSDPGSTGTTAYWMNALMCSDRYGIEYI